MKKILARLKKRFFNNKQEVITKDVLAKDVLSGRAELAEIAATAFLHPELTAALYRDTIVLIVSNNFVAEPSVLLSHFKRNYNFTIDEFVVLSYKLGMVTKLYIENPVYLLQAAVKLTDVFATDTIDQLQQLLNEQETHNRKIQDQKYSEFQIKLEEDKKKSKLRAIDIDADKKIDEWLKKNKRN